MCVQGECIDVSDAECERNADCDDGQTCDGGECVDAEPECEEDADCDDGQTCDGGGCVDAEPECEEDADCDDGQTCDGGECVDAEPECEEDADCDDEQVCDDGACVEPPPECEEDSDCGAGQACDSGECVDTNVLVIGGNGGGAATTISGTTLTFGAGTVESGATVTVEDVEIDTVTSAGAEFNAVGAFTVTSDGEITEPAEISIPNEDNLTADDQILVVEVVELADGTSAMNLVGTASVSDDGESIVTNNASDDDIFLGAYGVDAPGTYVVIATEGDQGITVGQVTDADGEAVAGAGVYTSSGVFVGLTDPEGFFAVPETIGSSTLYVTDPETGGYANIYVPVAGTTTQVEIQLIVPETVAAGLVNGCLDEIAFDSWALTGNTTVVASLGSLTPPQGGGMVLMTSGDGAVDSKRSGMDLTLNVPEGAETLSFTYKFLTSEYPTWLNTQYNDLFNVLMYTSEGATLAVEERLNTSSISEATNGYGGETPWMTASIDVSGLAGSDSALTLSFVVSDVGDSVVDSAALIDNLHFDDAECDNPGDGPPPMVCDPEVDEDCVEPVDADNDTYAVGVDCNDENGEIHPGAIEACDEIDNDCDGSVDEECVEGDTDLDTYVSIEDGGTDCDDTNAAVYPQAPELCDEIDNNCDGNVDESCSDVVPQSHFLDFSATSGFVSSEMYAIYERFESTRLLDLDGMTLTFAPDDDHTRYVVTASNLNWDSDVGSALTSSVSGCDDCYAEQPLAFSFNFYGTAYSMSYIGSNGYITFNAGDSTYSESVEYFLAGNPRISAMFDDLDTRGDSAVGDDVWVYSSESKLVVTFQSIQHYSYSGTSNTFQIVLLADGTVRISYDGIADTGTGNIAGISPGMISTSG